MNEAEAAASGLSQTAAYCSPTTARMTVEETERTVRMHWKDAEHRVSLDSARSLVPARPPAPEDVRGIVAAELGA